MSRCMSLCAVSTAARSRCSVLSGVNPASYLKGWAFVDAVNLLLCFTEDIELTLSSLFVGVCTMATQQQDTGASRGFAFVDFPSVEYAEYFVNSFGGRDVVFCP